MYNMDEKEDIMCTLPGRSVSHYLFTYCWSMVSVLILALYYQAFLALCHTYDQWDGDMICTPGYDMCYNKNTMLWLCYLWCELATLYWYTLFRVDLSTGSKPRIIHECNISETFYDRTFLCPLHWQMFHISELLSHFQWPLEIQGETFHFQCVKDPWRGHWAHPFKHYYKLWITE